MGEWLEVGVSPLLFVSGKEWPAVILDRYALSRDVIELLEEDLQASGFELLDVRIFRGGGRLQVRIYVDTESGIDLDGCARASRTAEMLLEESRLFTDRYVIEVSSPGVRRPLRKPAHFAAVRGQIVEARLGPQDEPRRIRGQLIEAGELECVVRVPNADLDGTAGVDEDVRLAYADMLEANLDPEFDAQALIQADRRQRKEQRRQERQERRVQQSQRKARSKKS
jgi:ribosome maturation factor RimP